MRPRVYVETSIVSYLTSPPSRDLVTAAHQELTRQWWTERASRFEIVISALVEEEASGGDEDAARERLETLGGIRMIALTDEAVSLAEHLVASGLIPTESAADALHMPVR